MFNPVRCLDPGRHYQYAKFPISSVHDEYKIAPFDVLSFNVLPNNGEKLLSTSLLGNNSINLLSQSAYSYTVEYDGKVKFPIFQNSNCRHDYQGS